MKLNQEGYYMKKIQDVEWRNWRKVCEILKERGIDINTDVELWQAITAWNKSTLELASQSVNA